MKYLLNVRPNNNLSYRDLNQSARDFMDYQNFFTGDYKSFIENCNHNVWIEIPSRFYADNIDKINFTYCIKKVPDTVKVKTDIAYDGVSSTTPWERPIEDVIKVKWNIEGIGVTNPDTGEYLGETPTNVGAGEILKAKWDGDKYDYLYILPEKMAKSYGTKVERFIPRECEVI